MTHYIEHLGQHHAHHAPLRLRRRTGPSTRKHPPSVPAVHLINDLPRQPQPTERRVEVRRMQLLTATQEAPIVQPNSVRFVRKLDVLQQADMLFLGVDSLDPEIGLMTPYLLEAQLNAQMIRIARQVVAVTDSSKLLRRNLSVIAPVDQVDLLITDSGADVKCIEAIRAKGIEVRLV